MNMNSPVSAERIHIGFFGRRNAGKSSLVNAVTGQKLSVVSDVAGTTTDTVQKAMELLPLGPVVIMDTPGFDDEGTLGELRVEKTREALRRTHIAVLAVDSTRGIGDTDRELLRLFEEANIPHLTVFTKSDLLSEIPAEAEREIHVSAQSGDGIRALKEKLARFTESEQPQKALLDGIIEAGDTAVLVVPLDESAPKGRLILPQQQTIQELLLSGAKAMVTRDTDLPGALAALAAKPRIVITDSQAFGRVAKITPPDVALTSFSILFVRYKGDLCAAVRGAAQLDRLRDGDRILISEGCTHHRQCGDIGTVKLPAWIRKHTNNKDLQFAFTSGREFPEDLSPYALVIHCGGCMLNDREMQNRTRYAQRCGVPMTNYGIAIAHMHGILRRSLSPFPDALAELDR